MTLTTTPQNRFCLFLSQFWPYILAGFLAGIIIMGLLGYIDAKNNFGESL